MQVPNLSAPASGEDAAQEVGNSSGSLIMSKIGLCPFKRCQRPLQASLGCLYCAARLGPEFACAGRSQNLHLLQQIVKHRHSISTWCLPGISWHNVYKAAGKGTFLLKQTYFELEGLAFLFKCVVTQPNSSSVNCPNAGSCRSFSRW